MGPEENSGDSPFWLGSLSWDAMSNSGPPAILFFTFLPHFTYFAGCFDNVGNEQNISIGFSKMCNLTLVYNYTPKWLISVENSTTSLDVSTFMIQPECPWRHIEKLSYYI